MAKKQKEMLKKTNSNAYIAGAGIMVEQPITRTLETNFMPYAMSVIVSRALPEIDGFKPSHRKLLYTMYKMGLLTGAKTKSANIVGQTMRLNPHGDQAIYETMVRLSKGYEALLHPYVESKGNFGKAYSRDMAYAASRYTEAKLAPICVEFFRDMDKDTVDFVPNYDSSTTEPTLFPTTFPSVLINFNVGIAVSMASNICPFNLKEVCETTIALLKNPDHDILETIQGPDFAGGGMIVYDQAELKKVIDTGRGSIKIRAKYNYDKQENCIEITEIPPTTTVEAIMDKIVDLVKLNKIKEIADLRDETDLSGLKLTLDLKRGVGAEKLMQKLFRSTPLQDNFACNFNILISGNPRVMGIKEILDEWIAFRVDCIKRRVYFDLKKKKEKLHLLKGLDRILVDIDKAIRIVRQTEEEKEVVPNLMIGFGIDEVQAEYVAEIKLRHLNREYILKRTQEIEQLIKDIAEMEDILANPRKIKTIIVNELKEVIAKHAQPRKTLFIYADDLEDEEVEEEIQDYPVNIFLTKEGYFKKITPQSLRMSGEHKLKETDEMVMHIESTNSVELLFFTDKQQVYKTRASEFEDTKTSVLGDYIPAKLSFDSDEKIVAMIVTKDYSGHMLFFFDNGKVAKVPISAYETKTKRKKLSNAYCDKYRLVTAVSIEEDKEFILTSTAKRKLLFHSAMINEKTTKNTQGVAVMTVKKNHFVEYVEEYQEDKLANPHRYRTKTLPATGAITRPEDEGEQLML
ncbi:DNA gyrase subunit A [Paludicola sp. MB14-C6]|uniref:DNA gyrase subunit A n=1 Tax=Paludihabitans sp. MB14-C6 TaxID=3070656 RepID=UPI0027DD7D9C|nr:DNA gyrase subunit A [Paludicola sp. MB14-C6]WMJ22177.1 DNA gyrase subunit A [Paludicola sp. MB14-C6]